LGGSGTKGYRHEMGDDRHRELLDLINSVKGKVLISCYQSEMYARALPAKRWRRVERMARTRNVNPSGNRVEVLYIRK
jgi:DNA adenine methylase